MSTPFKMKGWSPFTAKTKTVGREEDQPKLDKEEEYYQQQVKDLGLSHLLKEEEENLAIKVKGSYSEKDQKNIDTLKERMLAFEK